MTSGHEISPTVIEGADDVALPFSVEALDVRGRVVRLGPSVDTILRRHGYPDPVARLLGEAAALTVLLGSSLKFEGRFQFQTKSDGPVEMIVVDFEAPDRLRATARFDAERVKALGTTPLKSADLIGQGHLAMTIDQGNDFSRYQGVVALEGQSLEEAAHQYFPAIRADPDPGSPRRGRAIRQRHQQLPRRRTAGSVPAPIHRPCAVGRPPPGRHSRGPCPSRRGRGPGGRCLGGGAQPRQHGGGPRAGRSGGFLRAAALPAFPRARRAGVRGAAHPRALPVLTGARPRHDPLLRPRRNAATWSRKMAASASPASSARGATTSTPAEVEAGIDDPA